MFYCDFYVLLPLVLLFAVFVRTQWAYSTKKKYTHTLGWTRIHLKRKLATEKYHHCPEIYYLFAHVWVCVHNMFYTQKNFKQKCSESTKKLTEIAFAYSSLEPLDGIYLLHFSVSTRDFDSQIRTTIMVERTEFSRYDIVSVVEVSIYLVQQITCSCLTLAHASLLLLLKKHTHQISQSRRRRRSRRQRRRRSWKTVPWNL